jgi:hypothetical protein
MEFGSCRRTYRTIPRASLKTRFIYATKLDALDYAYTVAVEWLDTMKVVARHIAPHPDFDQT